LVLNKKQGSVRIIGGKWRGRKVKFPSFAGLRPTHDRIRETLFNWLNAYIAGSNCLECFSGSGALSFEALSRGANHVTLLEKSPVVMRSLQENVDRLTTKEQATILSADVPTQVPQLNSAPFDIVFLDPPFSKGLVQPTIHWLCKEDILKEHAFIYVEIERGHELLDLPDNWETYRHKHTSTIDYYLFRKMLGTP